MTSRPTPRLNHSAMWSCHRKTRPDSRSGLSASLAPAGVCSLLVFAIHLLQCKSLAGGRGHGGGTGTRENATAAGPASLREDYLSQVQRDSLSRHTETVNRHP